jgi:hypothetical protein
VLAAVPRKVSETHQLFSLIGTDIGQASSKNASEVETDVVRPRRTIQSVQGNVLNSGRNLEAENGRKSHPPRLTVEDFTPPTGGPAVGRLKPIEKELA